MSLIPWKNKRQDSESGELAPLAAFRNEVDRLFDSFFTNPFGMIESPLTSGSGWMPPVELSESDKEVTVRAEIPGVKPEDFNITVTGDALTISGEKKSTTEKKDNGVYHSETRYGSFRRQVRLPAEVDAEKVAAEYADGVLTVRLQKSPTAQPKRIAVTAK